MPSVFPFVRRALTAVSLLAALAALGACGGPAAPPAGPSADASIGALQLGPTTVFRMTLHAVEGVPGAARYDLLGEDDAGPVALGTEVNDLVVNATTIPLEVYDAGGAVVARATLDAADFPTYERRSFDLTRAAGAAVRSWPARTAPASASAALAPLQVRPDILAIGRIDGLDRRGTFPDQRIPLLCGGTPGTFGPAPADGYFIINDVAIEYYYAWANPGQFDDILEVKLIESDREFDNMQLYVKLPGAGQPLWNARTGQRVPAAQVPGVLAGVTGAVTGPGTLQTGVAIADLVISQFGPSTLVEVTVTRVEGACTAGARSFYVLERNEPMDMDAIEPIGQEFDENTREPSLLLLILGNTVDARDQELTECDQWTAANSGGAGTTVDTWDVSAIPTGAVFDFRFNAFSLPDKYLLEHPPGTQVLDTGWRGSSTYDGNPSYPGGVTSPGSGQVDAVATRGASPVLRVTVIGVDPSTAWNYSLRCRTS